MKLRDNPIHSEESTDQMLDTHGSTVYIFVFLPIKIKSLQVMYHLCVANIHNGNKTLFLKHILLKMCI